MVYWRQIRGISDPIAIRQFDGVYKPDDEGFNLPENLFTELINFGPDEYPAISTRPGYTVVGTFGTGVLGFGAWEDQELHAIFNDGSWRRLNNDGTWTSLATGLSTSAEWSFCNFQGNLTEINLIGANGTDPIKRYNGTIVQDLANAPAGGNYVTTQANRLYCAVANIIKFSALRKPSDWTTVNDAGEVVHETPDGETINGLKAGNGNVTTFKPSSTYELYGKGPTSYALEKIAADIGVTGNKAVAVYDDVLHYTSTDGLYHYAGGLRSKKEFSIPIQNYIYGMNQAQKSKCVSGSDEKYLYFGIPYGAGATQNNRIIQYDHGHQTWYTWDNIAVTQMIKVGEYLYLGDASGRVLRVGGTTDNGSAITATAITKPFTAKSISRKQQWFKLWVVASIPSGSSLSVYVSGAASGENWTLAKIMAADTNIQYREILIPTNSISAANAVRLKLVATGPVTIHEITRQLRELPMRR